LAGSIVPLASRRTNSSGRGAIGRTDPLGSLLRKEGRGRRAWGYASRRGRLCRPLLLSAGAGASDPRTSRRFSPTLAGDVLLVADEHERVRMAIFLRAACEKAGESFRDDESADDLGMRSLVAELRVMLDSYLADAARHFNQSGAGGDQAS
jgi:hypothetical protein